jgi:hypothetical protein
MRTVVRLGICSAIVILWLASWRVDIASGESSEACRNLATQFAEASEELDLSSLASLITCVTTEIQQRLPVANNTPQPVPQEAAPPPPAPAQQISSPQRQDYGAWPSPAPWSVNPPQSSPWDR